MRKRIFYLAVLLIPFSAFGQEIIIDFAGTGASTTVDSVEIVNLSNCTSIKVHGDSSVILIPEIVNIHELIRYTSSEIRCFPNPFSNSSKIQFQLNRNEEINLFIFNISGQIVAEYGGVFSPGIHEFEFTSQNSGIYFISLSGTGFLNTSKIFCTGNGTNDTELSYSGQNTDKSESDKNNNKSAKEFLFTLGDTLKLKGISGNYETVTTDVPLNSKTYTFEFIGCTDIDNNDYSIVEIANQIWMAENLKTTHYSDGTAIPHVVSDEDWGSLFYISSSKAYCYYNNNQSGEADLYGAMYTWAAASNNTSSSGNPSGVQGACPDGWHLPSKSEIEELLNAIGTENRAGKLKALCTDLWFYPNKRATNEFGWTGMPGGVRLHYWGHFQGRGQAGIWHLATEYDNDDSWSFYLDHDEFNYIISTNHKTQGKSVRCVLD